MLHAAVPSTLLQKQKEIRPSCATTGYVHWHIAQNKQIKNHACLEHDVLTLSTYC